MRRLRLGLALLLLILGTAPSLAGESGKAILDHYGPWRMFHVLKPPEIAFADEARSVVYPKSFWLNGETPSPPSGWTKPEFDDSDWLRGPAGMESRASFVARICL